MREKMKDVVLIIAIAIVLIVGLFVGCSFERTYKRANCKIVSIKNDTVIVKDSDNNFWSFKGKGFNYSDNLTLIMDTNNTDNIIKDDTIIKVTKE